MREATTLMTAMISRKYHGARGDGRHLLSDRLPAIVASMKPLGGIWHGVEKIHRVAISIAMVLRMWRRLFDQWQRYREMAVAMATQRLAGACVVIKSANRASAPIIPVKLFCCERRDQACISSGPPSIVK